MILKAVLIIYLLTISLFGSLYQKQIDIGNTVLLNNIKVPQYMLDKKIDEKVLSKYINQGFLLPSEENVHIVKKHQAAIVAIDSNKYFRARSIWVFLSAQYNDMVAQYNLGLIFELQLLSKGDDKDAEKWYQKAADQDYEPAVEALERLHEEEVAEWNIFEIPEVGVVYTTYALQAKEMQFGFIKPVGACNIDYIWLSYLGNDLTPSDEGREVHLDITDDGVKKYLDINTTKVYSFENGDDVVILSYIYIDKQTIDELAQVERLRVTTKGPEDLIKKLYALDANFDLLRLNDSRAEALRRCDLLSLDINETVESDEKNESNSSHIEEDNVTETINNSGMSTEQYWQIILVVLSILLLLLWIKRK